MAQQPAKSTGIQKVLLIGGTMRSGTTVIHRALCTARNSNPHISESWFFRDLLGMYSFRLSQFDVMGADQFGRPENFVRLMRTNIEYYLTLVSARYHDPDVLILKQPESIRYFPELASLTHRMLFLAIIRDPRDVIASMKAVKEKHDESGAVGPFTGMKSMAEMCAFYASHYQPLLRSGAKLQPRLRFVRYEDVMRDPKAEIAKIGEFCGAEYELDEAVEFGKDHAESSTFNKELRMQNKFSSAFWSDLYTKGISDERIGRYGDRLSPEEVAEIETRLRPLGERFGYWGSSDE